MRTAFDTLLGLAVRLPHAAYADFVDQNSLTPAPSYLHRPEKPMAATSSSWKLLEPPSEREDLKLQALFTDADAEVMMQGFVPKQMEDKWFIYFEDGWLRFHRSWTGAFIYAVRLDGSPMGVRVTESWVNRSPQQYALKDTDYDRKLVTYLIDSVLLKKSALFPTPPGAEKAPQGLAKHHYVGRA